MSKRVEGKFDFILERVRKRTPAQTRQRLIEIGILTKDGLILRWRTTGGGDQVWLRVEKREKREKREN